MQIPTVSRIYRKDLAQAEGIVIVIDVIRAFTVAAYAFAGGARCLWLVRTTEEAFALRDRQDGAIITGTAPRLAGEIGGRLIPGFDFNNSPALMAQADVHGKCLIQRTGAGTQGAVGASHAAHLLICSLVNAQATARYARKLARETDLPITIHPTRAPSTDPLDTNEDDFCADYLEALLLERPDAPQVLTDRIQRLRTTGRFAVWQQGESDFPFEDIEKVLHANRFDFAMVGKRREYRNFIYVEVEKVDVT